MAHLFDPLSLRSLEIRNRIFLPPMCQYQCAPDGLPNDWHLVHYGARAVGGTGLIIYEATAVLPEGRITPADCGLWDDAQVAAYRPITAFLKKNGAVPAIQLAHAGRKGSSFPPAEGDGALPASDPRSWTTVAPSALAFSPAYATPVALDEVGCARIVDAFAQATQRAVAAGFEAIEIHSAHGYLLHSFLSPLTNKRDDVYGGSLENRMRLPLAVAKAVRETTPQAFPVLVRVSATDWVEGGWDLAQTVAYCRELKALGIDWIDVSTGGLTPDAVIPVAPAFQVPFAEAVRREVGLPVSAVGLITDAQQAQALLRADKADAVGIGRAMLRDPQWPLRAAFELAVKIDWPAPYQRGRFFTPKS
jgi:2,4-dienoyl-CoA reductase-like NADH-dependent reductase (Old Yellow Enzyme family)